MIFFPFAFLFVLALLLVLAVAFAVIQIGLFGAAFAKAGISPSAVPLVLLGSLIGSGINIPVRRLRRSCCPPRIDLLPLGFRFRVKAPGDPGETLLAVNLGGAVIPVLVCLYILAHTRHPGGYLLPTVLVTALVHRAARPVEGFGIAVPIFLAPLVAAAAALLLAPGEPAPVAYVAGTLGCLFGADLLNLRKIVSIGARVASIGGAGTFDGVFLSGIIAVFLA